MMNCELKQLYMKGYNDLIFVVFQEEMFEFKYQALIALLNSHPDALAFVERVYSHRHEVCRTYTTRVFSAGATSSQRSESKNSSMKENGHLKIIMKITGKQM